MKKISIILIFLILLLICSCKMKIDGNLISLESTPISLMADSLDNYGFLKPRIKYLYFYSKKSSYSTNYEEYVDIIYNNGYAKTCSISEKEESRDKIIYLLDNKKYYLSINKWSNGYYVFFSEFAYSKRNENEYPNYDKYHSNESYSISSISKTNEYPLLAPPSFNDIQSYIKNGEVRGKVKSVSNKVFCVKEMFGKDSLILIKSYDLQYDKKGKLVSVKNNDLSNIYTYNNDGNIIKEYRKKYDKEIRVDYSYNDSNLLESISFYKDNKKYAFSNQLYSYDINMKLKSIDYYEIRGIKNEHLKFDRKIKYEEGEDYIFAIEYNRDGKEIRRNKYDKNYSLVHGLVDLGLESVNYNPLKSYDFIYTERKINVDNNKYNTKIELKYPYVDQSSYELLTYNEDCNLVKSYITEEISYSSNTMSNQYIMLYKYDSRKNWIERHSVLMYRDNKYEDVNQLRGYIERRDIQYFE